MTVGAAPLFSGEDITCQRGGHELFRGVGFALWPGDALLLTGPNGSGKTSLLQVMAGLRPPSAGRLDRHGRDIRDDLAAHAGRLHHVGHRTGSRAILTAEEDLLFWSRVRGRASRQRCLLALARFDLLRLKDLPVQALSSGQQRRLALARLLATPADIWLLDEPAVGLDRSGLASLEAAVARHRRSGGIAVIASHTPVELAEPVRRLALVQAGGRVPEHGS